MALSGYRNQGFMDGLMRGYGFVDDLRRKDEEAAFRKDRAAAEDARWEKNYGLSLKADNRAQGEYDFLMNSRPDASALKDDAVGALQFAAKDRATRAAGMLTPEQAAAQRDAGYADAMGGYEHNAWERGYKRDTAPDPSQVRRAYGLDVEGKSLGNQKIRAEIDYTNRKGLQGPESGKPPAGYRWTPDGNLQAIPGGPGDKPESIPAEMAARLALGESYISQVPDLKQAISEGKTSGVMGSAALAANVGDAGIIYSRQESGVDALIRNLTGAGMATAEAEKYARRYSLSSTDTSKRQLEKVDQLSYELKNIDETVRKLRKQPANDAYKNVKAPKSVSSQAGPKLGTVDSGYRFNGGDPSDAANWEKVK